jgi:hypothetical protein
VPVPPPSRGDDPRAKAGRPAEPLQVARQHDILHERDVAKAADAPERIPPDEDGLIAGCDAGQPRAQVHQSRHDGQEPARALDRHIEAPPHELAQRAQDEGLGVGGNRVSAWRKSSASPVAASAPAFIWLALPRAATRTRSAAASARAAVSS